MFLLLGDPADPLCKGVRGALDALGCPSRILSNPLLRPFRFSWRLDSRRSASRLLPEGEPPLPDGCISGVLVRHAGWLDPAGWSPDDLPYVQAEMQAALLAWLWSLSCPVVNRYPAAIWYCPQAPLLSWYGMLRRSGLPAPETLLTNVAPEALAFRRRLSVRGVPGAVYGPLTNSARYLLADDADWSRLAALQRCAPVSLASPHSTVRSSCVVGDLVFWNGTPPPEMNVLEPALCRFAAAAGLAFVEVALAATADGPSVVAVEPHPRFEEFDAAARHGIVEGLVRLLTADTPQRAPGPARSRQAAAS